MKPSKRILELVELRLLERISYYMNPDHPEVIMAEKLLKLLREKYFKK